MLEHMIQPGHRVKKQIKISERNIKIFRAKQWNYMDKIIKIKQNDLIGFM